MKKILTLILLVAAQNSFSQTSTLDTVKIKAAALEFCECTGPTINSLHPFILEMLEVISKKGEKAGGDTLTARLAAKPEEQAAVMKTVAFMDSEEFEKAIESCENKLRAKYAFADDTKPANKPAGEYFEKLMAKLPSCKYIHIMSVIGQKEGD